MDDLLQTNKRKLNLKRRIIVALFIILLGGGIFAGYRLGKPTTEKTEIISVTSPVPANVKEAVKFRVYYPDQAKMPKGYVLDTSSFSVPQENGVAYKVTYDTDKKIVFSVQPKPSDEELTTFLTSYIPLRTSVETPNGEAEVGAYNTPGGDTQTMGSWTATNDNTWIIFTAPYDTNQDNLAKVLQAFKS
jgi:hypothetical protein